MAEFEKWDRDALNIFARAATTEILLLRDEVRRLREAGQTILYWYDRNGSIDGIIDSIDVLRAALAPAPPAEPTPPPRVKLFNGSGKIKEVAACDVEMLLRHGWGRIGADGHRIEKQPQAATQPVEETK